MRSIRLMGGIPIVVLCLMMSSAMALDLLPKDKEKPEGIRTHYWLMSNGSPVGFRTEVEINGEKVTTIKRPGETLEVTNHVHPGLNTIRFASKDRHRNRTEGVVESGNLTITLGPESSRERQGSFGRMSIQLKELVVHFPRPAAHRAEESVVEMNFSLKEDPNPELANRYILFSQGEFSGHLIQVAVNGVPFMDVAGPGTHLDLNPFLKKGKNELTFSSTRMDGVPFVADEREKLKGKSFEVGVAVAGAYDPLTYQEPVTQVTTVVARYTQPADQEEPEEKETVTLAAE